MASDALRRLAAYLNSDIPISDGYGGYSGYNVEKLESSRNQKVFDSGYSGYKPAPSVTTVTAAEKSSVTEKPSTPNAVTAVTVVTNENDRIGNAASSVAGTDLPAPCEPETNGTVAAHIRAAGGQHSPALPVRPPRFETTGRLSLPVCTGWCIGCRARSTWRASPAPNASGQHWQCVRCGGPSPGGSRPTAHKPSPQKRP